MNRSYVEINEVVKTFAAGANAVRAVDGLSFCMNEGEFTVILGPSGAGKSTLLNMLGGMDTLTGGDIRVDGRSLARLNEKQLTLYRRNDVGFVFQFYNLMPNLTALENIELAVEICKNALSPRDILEKVGLAHRIDSFPSQLSGGEQQRVSIARAIAKNPKILLCDEPTGALDYNTGKMVLKLLRDMCRAEKKTVVVVTHNGALRAMADRVVYIKNGRAEKIETNANPQNIEDIEW
ncbi:ABC transporter ATP-binding protein [Clostridia bacterium]|nr:ABC transporter ATP-binding protein [Clostridia bacterium]